MNRRKAIKSLMIVGAATISSASIYEWYTYNSTINIDLFIKKKAIIAELADMIIPRTDTPGAKDAKVEDYIIKVMAFCTEPRTQHKFLNGLTDLEDYTINKYNHPFAKCSMAEKEAVLKHFDEKSKYPIGILNKINNKYIGKPFFLELKQLTVEGYCNSQLGATQGLAYDFIPATYMACIPLTKNQHSWATK